MSEDLSDQPHDHVVMELRVDFVVPRDYDELSTISYGLEYLSNILIDAEGITEEDKENATLKVTQRARCEDLDEPDPEITLDNVINIHRKTT